LENSLKTLSTSIGNVLKEHSLTISAAESCTGGLLSSVLTAISGSSEYFIGGVVAYSNRIKEEVLGVKHATLLEHGAVSEETACEMAKGINNRFNTDIGLSTTGIAGPKGDTSNKPVGLVWIGISTPENTLTYEYHFKGTRNEIQTNTVKEILNRLLQLLS